MGERRWGGGERRGGDEAQRGGWAAAGAIQRYDN